MAFSYRVELPTNKPMVPVKLSDDAKKEWIYGLGSTFVVPIDGSDNPVAILINQIVAPESKTSYKPGDNIKTGTIIRLQHMKTRRWLHSHLHASPISGNLEVSCFGDDGNSDTGDYWRIEIEGSEKIWRQDQRIRLRHVDTNGYLHSHNKKYNRIAGGQQEVCGVREKKADNIWLAAEGIYLPTSETKASM